MSYHRQGALALGEGATLGETEGGGVGHGRLECDRSGYEERRMGVMEKGASDE